jgi:hypothetical protein
LATGCASMVTLVHFSLAIGLQPIIQELINRLFARSVVNGNFRDLLRGYWNSYWPLLIYLSLGLSVLLLAKIKHPLRYKLNQIPFQIPLLVFVLATIPLLENLILLQHATQFSFDRLKFLIPAALFAAYAFAANGKKGRCLLMALALLACFYGYQKYRRNLHSYQAWAQIDQSNKRLAARIFEKIDANCTVFASNVFVRAYANLLFHRGIFEKQTLKNAPSLLKQNPTCAVVFLQGSAAYIDLPLFTQAHIFYKDSLKQPLTLRSMP